MKIQNYTVFFLLLCANILVAQEKNYNTKEDGKGGYSYSTDLGFQLSSKDTMPFWLQANKFGLLPNENAVLWNAEIKKEFAPEKRLDWTFGVMGTTSLGSKAKVKLRDYYVGGRYGKLRLFIGAKADAIQFDGLSSSNGSFIMSSNARPYPKISFEMPYTDIPYTKGILQFKGAFSEGIMYDNRYVDKPHVHHKNLYLRAKRGGFSLAVGMNHYAQWGGTSPRFGKLPSSLGAYRDVFFALDDSKYDQIAASFDHNRVGNHLGMLDVRFQYKATNFDLEFYRQVIFEDHSGQNLKNRDALNGIYITRKKENAWLESFLFEYYYTKYQSGDKIGKKPGEDKLYTGRDNYFNQSVYKSGWTSYGYTIGTPFFTALHGKDYALGVSNNRISALHGGVFGYIANKYPYRAMLSYTDNLGTYYTPIDKQQVSGYFEMSIPVKINNLPLNITWGIAADKGEYFEDNWGTFIKISTNGWAKK